MRERQEPRASDMDGDPRYRPCVGIMLLNAAGEVFVGKRVDVPGEHWQMPQGGIDPGETPQAAAIRELREEIGTDRARFLAELPGWIRYDLPPEFQGGAWGGRYLGQTQRWFAMRFTGRDEDIDLATEHPEFIAWKWVPMAQLPGLVIAFKRESYERVLAGFRHLLSAS